LVVTSEINAKLTQVLEPILADVRRLVGDQRRMTVVFDRGGFSPKLSLSIIRVLDPVINTIGAIREGSGEEASRPRRHRASPEQEVVRCVHATWLGLFRWHGQWR
jgi:hypothetical protein